MLKANRLTTCALMLFNWSRLSFTNHDPHNEAGTTKFSNAMPVSGFERKMKDQNKNTEEINTHKQHETPLQIIKHEHGNYSESRFNYQLSVCAAHSRFHESGFQPTGHDTGKVLYLQRF